MEYSFSSAGHIIIFSNIYLHTTHMYFHASWVPTSMLSTDSCRSGAGKAPVARHLRVARVVDVYTSSDGLVAAVSLLSVTNMLSTGAARTGGQNGQVSGWGLEV